MQVAKEKGDLSIALTLDEYTSKKSFQIPSLFQNSETPESDISKIWAFLMTQKWLSGISSETTVSVLIL